MKEEFKNMDDLFRQNFANESDVVPDFIKKNIDSVIEKKNRKFFYFWLSLSIFTLSLIAVGIYFYDYTNQSNQITKNQNNITDENQTTHTTPIAIGANNNSEEHNKNLNSINEINPNSENEFMKKINESQGHYSENEGTINQKKGEEFETSSESGKTKNEEDNQPDEITSSSSFKTNTEINSTKLSFSLNPKSALSFHPLPSTDLMFNQLVEKQKSPQAFYKAIDDNIPNISLNPQEQNHPWMVSVGPNLNLTNSTYTYSSTNDDSANTNAFSDQMSYGLEAALKYRFSNSLTFGTGIGYSTLKESYNYFQQDFEIDSTLTWSYVYDSLDTLQQFPIDSSYQATYDTTLVTVLDETGNNNASFIYIPFSIGTQIAYKKFIFELSAIGRISILLNASGKFFANNQLNNFDKSGTTYKRYSLNWSLAFNTYYMLSKQWLVYAGLRYQPKQNVINNSVFTKTQSSFIISTGIAFSF